MSGMRTAARRLTTALTAIGLGVGLLAGCSSGGKFDPQPTPVAAPPPSGKLTIGISFDQPGIGLKNGDTYTGFDVDTAIYIAKALGVDKDAITWREAKGDGRVDLLTSGGADLVVSAFSITDERKQKVDFAGPYFVAHQDLLVRRNEEDITGPDRLTGKTLCSIPGTTSTDTIVARYGGSVKLEQLGSYTECVAALANGDVDAVTTDDVVLAGFAATDAYRGKLKVVGRGFTNEVYGVGVRKGDTAMLNNVNAALKQYIADGSWAAALDDTVRPSGYAIPAPPTPGNV